MKLRPTQIVGLGAVVVFGSYLIFTLIKGPRDPDLLPSGVRISDLPTIGAGPIDTTPLPADPLAVGSQEAKDDLYCSGIVLGSAIDATGLPAGESEKLSNTYAALAETGRAKLVSEGAVKEAGAIAAGNAWSDKARADVKAKTVKITLEDCLKRPAAQVEPAPDLLSLGSQDARDDLYCSGLVYAEHSANSNTPADESMNQLNAVLTLAEAGTKKLADQGVAVALTDPAAIKPGVIITASVADAHTDKAKADYDARTPRIPLAACMQRAAALKPN
jgi:hypothetical protein